MGRFADEMEQRGVGGDVFQERLLEDRRALDAMAQWILDARTDQAIPIQVATSKPVKHSRWYWGTWMAVLLSLSILAPLKVPNFGIGIALFFAGLFGTVALMKKCGEAPAKAAPGGERFLFVFVLIVIVATTIIATTRPAGDTTIGTIDAMVPGDTGYVYSSAICWNSQYSGEVSGGWIRPDAEVNRIQDDFTYRIERRGNQLIVYAYIDNNWAPASSVPCTEAIEPFTEPIDLVWTS